MKPALAAIPDAYIHLALRNDGWMAFVSLLAMVIHGLQCLERAVMRVMETVFLYPFQRILHTYQHYDSAMVEYLSATCSMALSVWAISGRHAPNPITEAAVWWILAAPAALIGIFQGIAVQHCNHTTRSLCGFLAFMLWTWLSVTAYRRMGFDLLHVFAVPLMLACWLVILMHLRGQNGSTGTAE